MTSNLSLTLSFCLWLIMRTGRLFDKLHYAYSYKEAALNHGFLQYSISYGSLVGVFEYCDFSYHVSGNCNMSVATSQKCINYSKNTQLLFSFHLERSSQSGFCSVEAVLVQLKWGMLFTSGRASLYTFDLLFQCSGNGSNTSRILHSLGEPVASRLCVIYAWSMQYTEMRSCVWWSQGRAKDLDTYDRHVGAVRDLFAVWPLQTNCSEGELQLAEYRRV